MSASVMVARTRMWRTMVVIMRGGNLCGAAWQRLQLARNLFSPSTRMASASSRLRSAEGRLLVTTAGSAVASELEPFGGSAAKTAETIASALTNIAILIFIVLLSVPAAGRIDRRLP